MAEQINLTVAETKPACTDYRVDQVLLLWGAKRIDIVLKGTNGEEKLFHYSGVAAENLLKALNTANLSVKSLHRRILEKLVQDTNLSGSLVGLPD